MSYRLLFLQPVFTDLFEPLIPLLQKRFHCQGFYHHNFLEQLESSSEVSLIFGDTTCFKQFQNHPHAYADFWLWLENSLIKPEWLQHPALLDYAPILPETERLSLLLNRWYSQAERSQELLRLNTQLDVERHRLQDLNAIGAALSTERNLDKLLDKILASCMDITSSDSGSLYLREAKDEHGDEFDAENHHLRFKWARNQSVNIDFSEFTIPLDDRSIAGSVALHGEALNIPDVYHIGSQVSYSFNKGFDENTGYRSQSMLTVPMKNPQGEVVGVIQMINKKQHLEIHPYSAADEALLSSLASQAAIAIENARLYASIQSLFEGFIKASVQAIESRDPTTSGHSERVAVLTVGLAESVDQLSEGLFAPVHFSRDDLREIKYASLLHDFGKIGVREHVLVKSDKLYNHELDNIRHRFQLVRKHLENQANVQKLEALLRLGPEAAEQRFIELETEFKQILHELGSDFDLILEANRPSILAEAASERLSEIHQKYFKVDQESLQLLNDFELSRLSISKGSLAPEEREEIESHVTHTFEFLRNIPWTRELRNVPQIAYAHHEKLNGRGYPRRLAAADIPLQARMMTIADIYDALTASDRPYKKALPTAKALDILGFEVKDGMLDPDLYRLFVDARIYEKINV